MVIRLSLHRQMRDVVGGGEIAKILGEIEYDLKFIEILKE